MPSLERRSADSWIIEITDLDYTRRREEAHGLDEARDRIAELSEHESAVCAQVLSRKNPRRCLLYWHRATGLHDMDRRRKVAVDPADTPS